MKVKKRIKNITTEGAKAEAERSQYHFLNLPRRFLSWLERPGNLQTFQIYLSIQSIVLAAAYSWWQAHIGSLDSQESRPDQI